MPVSVTMPRLGESVSEGTVTRWLKKEGERVEADEPLLEVSTDKVDTEIPSPASGVVVSIKVQEDETVEVGVELAVIDDGSGAAAQAPVEPPSADASAPAAAPSPEAAPSPPSAAAPPPAAPPSPPTPEAVQINTVSGIATLNTSVQGLSSQFLQMQTLQGAALVGKNVIVPGNGIDIAAGVGQGGFSLTSAADAVKVDIVNGAGKVIDSFNLGAQSAGVHSFDWASGTYDKTANLTFKVTATSGATALTATPLMRDTVNAVSASGSTLQLQLNRAGTVDYSTVVAIN